MYSSKFNTRCLLLIVRRKRYTRDAGFAFEFAMALPKKRFTIARPTLLNAVVPVKWEKCCICQDPGTQGLICPANNPVVAKRNQGYTTLSTNLELLRPHNHVLPSKMIVSNLDVTGKGIFDSLIVFKAKWHRACALKYTGKKFEALLAKEAALANPDASVPEASTSEGRGIGTRSSNPIPSIGVSANECFICGKTSTEKEALHLVSTPEMRAKIELYVKNSSDPKLVAAISVGDILAKEAKYHRACLSDLRYKSTLSLGNTSSDKDSALHSCESIAFAELILFIRNKLDDKKSEFAFTLVNLKNTYQERLAQLIGTTTDELPYVHNNRFKDKILAQFNGQIKAEISGNRCILKREKAHILSVADWEDQDRDAVGFLRFCKTLRRDMLDCQVSFSGTFEEDCEVKSIPPTLLAAMNAILYGSATQLVTRASKPVVTICQLIIMNQRQSVPTGQLVRHKRNYEPHFPMYLALSMFGKTRSKTLLNELHNHGLTPSYDRIMQVTSGLCHLVARRAADEGVLCPSNLQRGLFTVAAYDNIDHNPSSTTSQGSFHGTSVSIFQLPSRECCGEDRSFSTNYLDIAKRGKRDVPILPDHYSVVPEFVLLNKQPEPNAGTQSLAKNFTPIDDDCENLWRFEKDWLDHVYNQLLQDNLEDENVSWGAYHASQSVNPDYRTLGALLPLFHELSSSVSMMKHGMDVVKAITKHLNRDQVPVLCLDQPLYALAKQVQWSYSSLYGEDKFVILFAPFHIEQSFLRVLGQLVEDSGWVEMLAFSGIITEGSAEACRKVTHVTKARLIHEITAAVLHALMTEAFEQDASDSDQSIEEWIIQKAETSPTFKFWLLVFNLEILLLNFVRSIRLANYALFLDSVKRLMPWFFAFNRPNYARWLSIHIKDLCELPVKAPDVHAKFSSGDFVVRKTLKKFSALAIDQAHEQHNARVKADGGAVGLTQDPDALRRWTVGGPELSRLIVEFRTSTGIFKDTEKEENHHEQYLSFQKKFLCWCATLKEAFAEFGNPFSQTCADLLILHSRVVIKREDVKNLYSLETEGKQLYKVFMNDRIVQRNKSLYDPIHQIANKFFSSNERRKPAYEMVKELKVDLQLFSNLFIVSKSRELDMEEFFRHENQNYPPALSQNGSLRREIRTGDKAKLAKTLHDLAITKDAMPASCEGIVYDGAALVHIISPKISKTFGDYFVKPLRPHILNQAKNLKALRTDLVWDLYPALSTKNIVRTHRGDSGLRRQIVASGKIPSNWKDFLSNSANKEDLFRFVALKALEDRELNIVTNVGEVLRSGPHTSSNLPFLTCRTKEEADGRIILHVADMSRQGIQRVMVRTVDTDVLVLTISYFAELKSFGLQELWVSFGTGKHSRFIPSHEIADVLGDVKCKALRMFHAFTGCDTVSYFASKGKPTAWKAWMKSPDTVTQALARMSCPDFVPDDSLDSLQELVVKMYDPKSQLTQVNDARKHVFCVENRTLLLIPPTAASLYQHMLRAAYQAGQVWGRAISESDDVPSPEGWGWTLREGIWTPVWSKLPSIWLACRELAKCGCTKGCTTMRCACRKNSMPCSPRCKCGSSCQNESSQYEEADADTSELPDAEQENI